MSYKSVSFLMLLISGMWLSSCSRNTALFDIDAYMELTMLAGTAPDRVFGFEQEILFPYETSLAVNTTSLDNINAVKASQGLLFPKLGENINLNFIAEVTIDAIHPDDYDRRREVFYYEQFNFAERTQIELAPSLPNIIDFIKDDRLFLNVEFIFNRPPPRTFDLAFELEFGAIEEG